MNEDLQATLTSVIADIVAVGEKAYQFGEDQLPLVIEELILFNTFKYALLIVFYLAPLVALGLWWMSAFAQKVSAPNFYYDRDKDPDVGFGFLTVASVLAVIPLALFVGRVIDLLLITLAPRVWLLEYAAAMIK